MSGLNRIAGVAAGLERIAATGGDAATGASPSIVIVRRRCTHYRHRASTCALCRAICPAGAIDLSENYPVLNDARCMACGACAAVCPMEAMVLQKPADRELAGEISATAGRRETVTLRCQRAAGGSPRGICLPCLARLEPSMLLLAPAGGVLKIRLIAGECHKCPVGNMLPHLHATIASAEQFAAASGARLRISLEVLAAEIDLSRRAWFTKLLGRENAPGRPATIATAASDAAASDAAAGDGAPPDKGDTARRPPEKRRRFVAALRALAGKTTQPVGTIGALSPAPKLNAARCVGCALCADVCPTGALTAEKKAASLRIACNAAACVACGMCVDVCYRQAIALYPGGDIGNLVSPQCALLLERRANNDLLSSCEDKIGALLGAPVYRT